MILSKCRDEKAAECTMICPVDCIELGPDQYYIDPNRCIDCGACVAACPVNAIVNEMDLPSDQSEQLVKAENFFS